MKNIHRNKTKFQIFLETVIFVIRILFTEVPITDIKPFVFISPFSETGETRLLSGAAFELKQRGGGVK